MSINILAILARGRLARPTISLALALAIAIAGDASAQPVMDTLCGTTLTESLTLEADIDCTRFPGVAITIGASDVTLDGNGYRLLAPDSEIAVAVAPDVLNASIENLEILGWCTGIGIAISGGAGHRIQNVDATGRSVGVDARNTTDLTIIDLTVHAASDAGLYLDDVSLPLTLQGLDLSDNLTGLRIRNLTGPFTLDSTAITDIRGSDTGIHLVSGVHGLTIEGLTIDGDTAGIDAYDLSHTGLTFRDLDLTARVGGGRGIYLRGEGHTIEHVRADRRLYGVHTNAATDLSIHDLEAHGATGAGLYLATTTPPLSLSRLTLTDSQRGLWINGFPAPNGFRIDPFDPVTHAGVIVSVGESDTGLQLDNIQNAIIEDLVLDNPATAIDAYHASNEGLTFRRLVLSGRYRGGNGLYLRGQGHVVEDVQADLRATGVWTRQTSDLSLDDVRCTGCATGIYLQQTSGDLSLRNLAAEHCNLGIRINNLSGAPDSPLELGPYDPDSEQGTIRSLHGSGTGLQLQDLQHARVHDLRIDCDSGGVDAGHGANADITFEDLDLSGNRRGVGLALEGDGHRVLNLTANHRDDGLQLDSTGDIIVDGLTATGCDNGLAAKNIWPGHEPVVLNDLDLRDNHSGVFLDHWTMPYTFGPDLSVHVADSQIGYRVRYSANITFDGLTLANPQNGIFAERNSEDLTFTNLVLSGDGLGVGLRLGHSDSANTAFNGGAGHTVTNVISDRRVRGVYAIATPGLTISGLAARDNAGAGLTIEGVPSDSAAPSLSDLNLTDNAIGLELIRWHLPFAIEGAIGLDVGGSATGIYVNQSSDLTFRDLTIDSLDIGIHVDMSSTNLTFEDVDLSGSGLGTGLVLGRQNHTTASGHRAGPGHVLNRVSASRRQVGLDLRGVDGFSAEDVTAEDCDTGIALDVSVVADSTPPSLRRLNLARNGTALHLMNVHGTPQELVLLDPWTPSNPTGAIVSTEGSGTGIRLDASSFVHFDALTLDNADFGIDASSTSNHSLLLTDLDLSGGGQGRGLHLRGSGHTLIDVAAHDRDIGLFLHSVDDIAVIGATTSGARSEGFYLHSVAPPISLSDIRATDSATGLRVHAYHDPVPLLLNDTAITAIGGNSLAIHLSSSSTVVVDDTSLGLVPTSTNFVTPAEPSDPLCETTLLSDLTLTSDLDCSGVTGTALTLGADGITLDGAGHRIIAPHASVAVDASDVSDVTVQNLDLSGRYGGGVGARFSGGEHNTITQVIAEDRATGLALEGGQNATITALETRRSRERGLSIVDTQLPIHLEALSLTDGETGLYLQGVDGQSTLAIDPTTIAALGGNQTSIELGAGVSGVRFENLTLDGSLRGLDGRSAALEGLTFEGLGLTPVRPGGTGLELRGTGHDLIDIDAAYRSTGVALGEVSDTTVTRLHLTGASSVALVLDGGDPSVTLTDLSLTGSEVALSLIGVHGTPSDPFLVIPYDPIGDTGTLRGVSGSRTGVEIGASSHVELRELTLPNRHRGVDADSISNGPLRIIEVDATGHGLGQGFRLRSTSLELVDATADRRSTGFFVRSATDLLAHHIRASGGATCIELNDLDGTTTLTDLTAEDCATGLVLSGLSGLDGAPFSIGPYDAGSDSGAITSLAGSDTALDLRGVSHLRIHDLTLPNRERGIEASTTSNTNLLFENVDVSSPRGAYGMYLQGAGHTLDNVTADGRTAGLYLRFVPDLTITNTRARRSGTGLWLRDLSASDTPPTLQTVDLSDNGIGLHLQTAHATWTLDSDAGVDLSGSDTGIRLNAVSNLTLRDLTLDNRVDGIDAAVSSNSELTFDTVDASGHGGGNGLNLSGSNLTLTAVTANHRATGVGQTNGVPGGAITDLTATGCSTRGLQLHGLGASQTPPTLSGLTLRDNLDGLRIASWSAPLVIAPDIGLDVSGSRRGLRVENVANVTFQDLSLSNPLEGIHAAHNSNDKLTFTNLDLSGTGRGDGLTLRGADHTLSGITIARRTNGIDLTNTNGLTASVLELADISARAISLTSTHNTPPTLSDIRIQRSDTGLYLSQFTGPLVIDDAVLTLEAGNRTSLWAERNVTGLTIRDLGLSGRTAGLRTARADARFDPMHEDITIERVHVSGSCAGTGLWMAGGEHTLSEITAARRAVGVNIRWGGPFHFDQTVIGANVVGMDVNGSSRRLDATVAASPASNETTLHLSWSNMSNNGPITPDSVLVFLPSGVEVRDVLSQSGSTLTLTAPLSAVPPPGTVVQAPDAGDPRVFVHDSDICANGTGATVQSGNIVAATSNYWRASDGPLHPDNPAGTGDSIVADDTTYDPWNPVPTDKDNHYCNQAPVADAGEDQVVCEGDAVTLDASASYDPDIEPLDFTWTQREGTEVPLTGADEELATFTAPTPAGGADNELFVFRVRADDGHLWRTDDTQVLVLKGNSFPTAVPGPNQSVDEGDPVSLDGGASFDPEGQPLSYVWEQLSGPPVTLAGADTSTPSFTAPLLDVGGAPLSEDVVLSLTVTDLPLPEHCGGPRSHSETLTITVNNVNQAPIADAGDDQQALEATGVTLDGTASTDPDGDPLTFAWVQISGAPVTLTGADSATPTFTTPTTPPAGSEVLVFQLTVSDGFGGTDTDTVTITLLVDHCPDDPDKMEPGECGCGVPEDTGDDDGDGVINCLDGCPQDPDKIDPGVCGCGTADTDTDGDGTPDCIDGCPEDPLKTEPGICGCGVDDDPTDTDEDGVPDCIDGCPFDPLKTEPGECGCGVPDTDSTGDGLPDCLSDCAELPDGTIIAEDVPCGLDACGDLTGTDFCEGGMLISTCDAAYDAIFDTTCGADLPTVAYAIAFTPDGEPHGTIRCTRDSDGVVTCDTRPDDPSTLLIHDGLFCPGYDSW